MYGYQKFLNKFVWVYYFFHEILYGCQIYLETFAIFWKKIPECQLKMKIFKKVLKFLFLHFLLSRRIFPSEMWHIYIWILPPLNFASMKRLNIFRLRNRSKNPS